MTIVARETLAKSEVEIVVSTVATLLVSASRMISGEVVPNFEAIVEQNEMSFAQKRKDVSTVKALLTSEDAVVPMLQKAAEMIRELRTLSEAITLDTVATVQKPAKPLPEGSLLRDTLRRLQYVQKVVESVAKWINDIGEHNVLKGSVPYTKIEQELIRTFKRVVIQVQQAAVIIGKYRDMGDIRVLREMTIEAQAVLGELKEADESVAEKRKSISFFKRVVEESKSAPKVVRQLGAAAAGLVTVVLLSVAVIQLNALAPQVFQPTSEPVGATSVEQEMLTPSQDNRTQEAVSTTETTIKRETDITQKNVVVPIKREEVIPTTPKPAPPITSPTPKPDSKETNLKENKLTSAQKPEPTKTNANGEINKAKSMMPVLKKATSKSEKKRTTKAAEQQITSPKAPDAREAGTQKKLENVAPKRKTIVIED
jgi:hypothetical protein